MCRIVGVWNNNGGTPESLFIAMRDTLSYGGPDDAGAVFLNNGLCLGHRRLSILDLSQAGHQPFQWQQYTLIFNGEVYNYKEINKELSEYTFSSHSDTETIIKAWDKWGPDSVKRFRGMFAFALWDDREKKLYLVRDRMGVKPLFYQLSDGLLLFGSELKALLVHPQFDKQISQEGLSLYLQQGYIPSPFSIFKETKKLQPGTILEVDENLRPREITYWNAVDSFSSDSFNHIKANKYQLNEWKELVHNEIKEAFQLRMVSDVPVGMFLSGGVDSSLVSAVLQKESNTQLKTFTIGFREEAYNEAPFAQEVAKHIGTDHYERIVDEKDFENVLPKLPELFDEPNGDASIIPTYIVSKFAKEHVKVSLSADGGDEFFGGYTKYEITKNLYPKLVKLPGLAKNIISTAIGSINSRKLEQFSTLIPGLRNYKNFDSKVLKFKNALQAKDYLEFFNLASSFLTPKDVEKLTDYYFERIQFDLPLIEKNRLISYLGMIDVKTYMEGDVLTKVDRATMHNALEGREPLLDHKLFELAMQLPDELKIRGNSTKYILRQILFDYVPEDIIERPKQGFAIPLEDWLQGSLKEDIEEMYNSKEFLNAFQLDSNEVKKLVKNFYQNQSNPQVVWYLYVLFIWYKRYLA